MGYAPDRVVGEAEEAVRMELDELRLDGWTIMHDVSQPQEGAIDHILAGPAGLFLLATRRNAYTDRNVVKVRRQAARLHDELGVWITPVVCLYGHDQAPMQQCGVWVIPRSRIIAWLRAQCNQPVDVERLARFAGSVIEE
jgi:hypothetical protein